MNLELNYSNCIPLVELYIKLRYIVRQSLDSRWKSVFVRLQQSVLIPLFCKPTVINNYELITSLQESHRNHKLGLNLHQVFTGIEQSMHCEL
jgi:hypothetical protein